MLSKNKVKLISALSRKKFRDEHGLFIAEGTKLVLDLTETLNCKMLIATNEWLQENKAVKADEIIEVTSAELSKISNQKTPQGVLGVFEKPQYSWTLPDIINKLSLALDDVQDPGNLGTIIRIADWFGIEHIFCSKNTADVFSPKVVQATMGALARVKTHEVNLEDFLTVCKDTVPLYGTFLDGKNIYETALSPAGIIIMGNEGNGISKMTEKHIENRLFIPNYPLGADTSESLNVGVATALVCAEFRRRLN